MGGWTDGWMDYLLGHERSQKKKKINKKNKNLYRAVGPFDVLVYTAVITSNPKSRSKSVSQTSYTHTEIAFSQATVKCSASLPRDESIYNERGINPIPDPCIYVHKSHIIYTLTLTPSFQPSSSPPSSFLPCPIHSPISSLPRSRQGASLHPSTHP